MALISPSFYVRLEQFYKEHRLKELEAGAVGKAGLLKWISRDKIVANIRGLGSKMTEACWKNFAINGVTN